MARISTITLPTPYMVGDVNVYLVEDEKLVLIDTGAPTDDSYLALEAKLKNFGYEIRDVSEIIVTHFHPDHFGLAGYLGRMFDIPVRIHPLEIYFLNEDREKVLKVVDGWGLPQQLVDAVVQHQYRIPPKYFQNHFSIIPLFPGETIKTGEFAFKVIYTPGHSLGHISLYEMKNKYFFSGDFILKNIFPNPLIYQVEGQRIATLPLFLESLNEVYNFPVKMVFPAHQDKFSNLQEVIDKIKIHYFQKTFEVYEKVKELKKANLFEIAQKIYPDEIKEQTYLVISKVLGCLDLLREAELVGVKHGEYVVSSDKILEGKKLLNEKYFYLYKPEEEF
ncbi:MBL fold metallo-hydrolase [Carboxydothermus ferrireducens]|uniref:Glyoxylase-like metal-dependent hydrolase (Beta-lactamase superfamily II) n=1 Tax=Carboxydothermus ferrireducens DSM 11255 TaxID=1119529 RepID=A0ABX2RER3_9THEO|nr:MBL fold metallo-hydrolase [Carboxydothermus ferrireducens]NYE58362.1 glyoxylase-like metal-dependent hydrolase (beta-lactamase superfamily II) [Carboxydothermus ferrireducens DSM 11255]